MKQEKPFRSWLITLITAAMCIPLVGGCFFSHSHVVHARMSGNLPSWAEDLSMVAYAPLEAVCDRVEPLGKWRQKRIEGAFFGD